MLLCFIPFPSFLWIFRMCLRLLQSFGYSHLCIFLSIFYIYLFVWGEGTLDPYDITLFSYRWTNYIVYYILYFIHLFFCCWPHRLFHHLAIVNSATINTDVQVFLSYVDSASFGLIPRRGRIGSYGKSIFSFFEEPTYWCPQWLNQFIFSPEMYHGSFWPQTLVGMCCLLSQIPPFCLEWDEILS